jgi:preprotein translocase subunit SecA
MIGILSKIFGGNKSEKDIKGILPVVEEINKYFLAYNSLTNDELRAKTSVFKARIAEHLGEIDTKIAELNKSADELPFNDIGGKDVLYQEIDKLKKDRDTEIEEVLEALLPEAFAVVKETARRFKENAEMVSTATELDRNLSIKKEHIRIDGSNPFTIIPGWLPGARSPGTWYIMMCS